MWTEDIVDRMFEQVANGLKVIGFKRKYQVATVWLIQIVAIFFIIYGVIKLCT